MTLGNDYEVYEVMLPGRSTRMGEPAAKDARQLAASIAREAAAFLAPLHQADRELTGHVKPTIFVGFAFGAVLAYEAAVEMERLSEQGGHPAREGSGAGSRPRRRLAEGPHGGARGVVAPHAERGGLCGGAARRGGTEEVLAEPELLELFLPTMRADVHGGALRARPGARGHVPIVAMRGAMPGPKRGDTLVAEEHAALWRGASTSAACRVHTLEAFDWFMLEDAKGQVALLSEVMREARYYF